MLNPPDYDQILASGSIYRLRHALETDAGLGAAGDHDVRVAAADVVDRVADGVSGAGAGGRVGRARALEPESDRDVARGGVGHETGDGEGVDPVRSAVAEGVDALLDGVDAADARSDNDAAAGAVLVLEVEPGGGDGLDGGTDVTRVTYRSYTQLQGSPGTGPSLAAIFVGERPAVIISARDLSVGALGSRHYRVNGYAPDSARDLLSNLLLWAEQTRSAP